MPHGQKLKANLSARRDTGLPPALTTIHTTPLSFSSAASPQRSTTARTYGQAEGDVVAEVGVAALGLGDVLGAVAEDLSVELWQGHTGFDHLLLAVGQHDRGPARSLRLAGEVGVLAQLAHALQPCNTRFCEDRASDAPAASHPPALPHHGLVGCVLHTLTGSAAPARWNSAL